MQYRRAGRMGSVVEDVAQMGLALVAHDLDPPHAVARVGHFAHGLAIDRLPEARPTGAGIELGLGTEQRRAAADATIDAAACGNPNTRR